MKEEQELLKPKVDVVFHSLFRKGNERITKALITSIINEKIEKVELDKDRYIVGEYPEDKLAQWIQFLDNPNEKGVLNKVMEKAKK